MLFSSFSKFLAITPSRLGQENFNELAEFKRKKVAPVYIEKLSSLEAGITTFNEMEHIKCLKSSKYLTL